MTGGDLISIIDEMENQTGMSRDDVRERIASEIELPLFVLELIDEKEEKV